MLGMFDSIQMLSRGSKGSSKVIKKGDSYE